MQKIDYSIKIIKTGIKVIEGQSIKNNQSKLQTAMRRKCFIHVKLNNMLIQILYPKRSNCMPDSH